jgi:hypothetical protein
MISFMISYMKNILDHYMILFMKSNISNMMLNMVSHISYMISYISYMGSI